MVTLFDYFKRKEDSLPNSEGPVFLEVLFHQLIEEKMYHFLDHGSENGPIWSNLVQMVLFPFGPMDNGPDGPFSPFTM